MVGRVLPRHSGGGRPLNSVVSRQTMSTATTLAKVSGVSTALMVTVVSQWAFAVKTCHDLGGAVVGSGLLCETPACPAYSLSTYVSLPFSAIALVLIGLPLGLGAYSIVKRLLSPLPPKSGG